VRIEHRLQSDPFGIGGRLHRVDRSQRHVSEIHRLDVETHLTGDGARDIEQVVHQLRLRLGVALDGFDCPALLILANLSSHEHAGPSVDRGQRRAQLVRHGHQEFVLHPVGQLLAPQELGALLEIRAQLELPAPAAQGDRHRARQDETAYRPLENGDVAKRTEHRQRPLARRGEMEPGEHDDRNVRPGRLLIEATHQRAQRLRPQRLLRDQQRAGGVANRRAEVLDGRADGRVDALGPEHRDRELRVPADRRENADGFASPGGHSWPIDPAVPRPCRTGTPVSTP
jgi:hypothetical protein